MDINKSVLFLLVACLASSLSYSQTLGEIIFGPKSKIDYLGQYTDNHKSKNGLGIQRYKNGDVFIGDFNHNKPSGKGMLIVGKGKIENAPDAIVYVGSWKEGKKQGKGTCYAANGDILYQGKFINDKPVDTYPTPTPKETDYFTMKEFGNNLYWGEVTSGVPNGFGLIIQENNSFWFGNLKDGKRTGVCMTVYGPDSWEVGKWEDNMYTAFNNSKIVANRRSEFVDAKRRNRSQLMEEFWGVAQGLTEVGIQAAQMKANNQNNISGTGYESSSSNSSKNSSRTASTASKAQNDCGTAWMTESRAYSNYETQIIRDCNSLSASDIKSIQSKMRSIRQKWEKRGCPITKSVYEDKLPN